MSKFRPFLGVFLIVLGCGGAAGTLNEAGLLNVSGWHIGGDSAIAAERILLLWETADAADYSAEQFSVLTGQADGTVRAFCKGANIDCALLDKDSSLELYPDFQPLMDAYKAKPDTLPVLLYSKNGVVRSCRIETNVKAPDVIAVIGGKQ